MKPNDFSQLNVLTEADFSHRSPVREERHPNAVTAPPVNRGSMAPRPWRGFWNSLGTAVLVKLGAGGKPESETAEAGAQGRIHRQESTVVCDAVDPEGGVLEE